MPRSYHRLLPYIPAQVIVGKSRADQSAPLPTVRTASHRVRDETSARMTQRSPILPNAAQGDPYTVRRRSDRRADPKVERVSIPERPRPQSNIVDAMTPGLPPSLAVQKVDPLRNSAHVPFELSAQRTQLLNALLEVAALFLQDYSIG